MHQKQSMLLWLLFSCTLSYGLIDFFPRRRIQSHQSPCKDFFYLILYLRPFIHHCRHRQIESHQVIYKIRVRVCLDTGLAKSQCKPMLASSCTNKLQNGEQAAHQNMINCLIFGKQDIVQIFSQHHSRELDDGPMILLLSDVPLSIPSHHPGYGNAGFTKNTFQV